MASPPRSIAPEALGPKLLTVSVSRAMRPPPRPGSAASSFVTWTFRKVTRARSCGVMAARFAGSALMSASSTVTVPSATVSVPAVSAAVLSSRRSIRRPLPLTAAVWAVMASRAAGLASRTLVSSALRDSALAEMPSYDRVTPGGSEAATAATASLAAAVARVWAT